MLRIRFDWTRPQLNWGVSRCIGAPYRARLLAQRSARIFRRMADAPNIKPDAHRLVDSLPDSAGWDDLAYEVYVRQAIEVGLAEADAGRLVSHDDALARVRARIRRAS